MNIISMPLTKEKAVTLFWSMTPIMRMDEEILELALDMTKDEVHSLPIPSIKKNNRLSFLKSDVCDWLVKIEDVN